MAGWIVLGIVVIVALWAIATYNGFVTSRNRCKNAWAQVDVQLRRRYDLIPNLVETVKGHATHERETFDRVTQARAQAIAAGSVGQQTQAENVLSEALRSLFAVAEAYPEMRANQNFRSRQEELSGTESKIAFARQFYNDTVMRHSILRESFPAAVIANSFGFGPVEFFEVDEASAREPVKVDFHR